MPRQLSKSKEVIEFMVGQGIPRNVIAKRFCVSPSTITAFCRTHSIGKKRIALKNFHNEIVADVEKGRSWTTIALKYGATVGAISKYLKTKGYQNPKRAAKPHSLDPHRLVIQEMLTQGYSQKEIAKRVETHPSTLNVYIMSRKLKPRSRRKAGMRPKPNGHVMANVPAAPFEPKPNPTMSEVLQRGRDRAKYDPSDLPLEKPVLERFAPQTDDGKIRPGMCNRCGVRRLKNPDEEKYCVICTSILKSIDRKEQEKRDVQMHKLQDSRGSSAKDF